MRLLRYFGAAVFFMLYVCPNYPVSGIECTGDINEKSIYKILCNSYQRHSDNDLYIGGIRRG